MLLAVRPRVIGAPARAAAIQDEESSAFETLAMTDELRQVLFPKSPRMVSTIFDRPPAAAQCAPAPGGKPVPIVL